MDVSPAALRKLRAELEMRERDMLDEMGVGAIHAGYAEALFPGTSVLQTRARYLLFVPWTYLWLARQPRITPERLRARKDEVDLWLIGRLLEAKQQGEQQGETGDFGGIIGERVYTRSGRPPAQPPDVAYWSALRTYGIYRGVQRAQLLARWDRNRVVRRQELRPHEERIEEEPLACFDIPPMPGEWMADDAEISFRLEPGEAKFLQERLMRLDPPCLLGVAAARLGPRKRPTAAHLLWEDAFMREAAGVLDREHDYPGRRPASAVAALARTREASALAELVRAIYAALVETLREQDLRATGRMPLPDDSNHYRDLLRGFWEGGDGTVDAACALSLRGLAADIDLPGLLPDLLATTHARICTIRRAAQVEALLLDDEMLALFTRVEWKRKDVRARLPARDGRPRRATFGAGTVPVTGIGYRWRVVFRLLGDIQRGLRGASDGTR